MFFIKMRFLAVHIEGPFGAAPAPAPHQTECTIGSSGRWFLCEGPDKRPEGGEWEPKIRFENREKDPDCTQRTSDDEYQYRIVQNGYRH